MMGWLHTLLACFPCVRRKHFELLVRDAKVVVDTDSDTEADYTCIE